MECDPREDDSLTPYIRIHLRIDDAEGMVEMSEGEETDESQINKKGGCVFGESERVGSGLSVKPITGYDCTDRTEDKP